jgi:PI4-kinase N-terminal region
MQDAEVSPSQYLIPRGGLTVYSTHALAREVRFSFLLFGFETLKCSYLDSYCENILRENLYQAAYTWFSVRPQCVEILSSSSEGDFIV